jgi:hypothetical protein
MPRDSLCRLIVAADLRDVGLPRPTREHDLSHGPARMKCGGIAPRLRRVDAGSPMAQMIGLAVRSGLWVS